MSKIYSIMILIVISMNLMSASEIIPPYKEENPLKLSPGETQIVELIIKNTAEEEKITLNLEVKNIDARLLNGPTYPAIPGEDIYVQLEISVPKNASPGETHEISISIEEYPKDKENIFRITSSATAKFPVKIIGDSDRTDSSKERNLRFLFLAIIAILLIKIFLTKKR